jgi:hypothetical protein
MTESPTAPQPITPTRAPSHTAAVLSTEQTPVATAHPIKQACSGGNDVVSGTRAALWTTVRVLSVPVWRAPVT